MNLANLDNPDNMHRSESERLTHTQNPFEVNLTIVGVKIGHDHKWGIHNPLQTCTSLRCLILTSTIVRFTSNGFWVQNIKKTLPVRQLKRANKQIQIQFKTKVNKTLFLI
jgi:hypothetical protein